MSRQCTLTFDRWLIAPYAQDLQLYQDVHDAGVFEQQVSNKGCIASS